MTTRLYTTLSAAIVGAAALIALGFSGVAEASYYYDEQAYRGGSIPCYAYDSQGHCTSYTRSRTGRTRYDYRYNYNSYNNYYPYSYYRPVDNRYRRNDDCYWYYGNYRCSQGSSMYYPYGYSQYPYGY